MSSTTIRAPLLHIQVMEEMSRHYNAGAGDWRQRDDWGWTLLHEAAHTARPDIIQVTAENIKKAILNKHQNTVS